MGLECWGCVDGGLKAGLDTGSKLAPATGRPNLAGTRHDCHLTRKQEGQSVHLLKSTSAKLQAGSKRYDISSEISSWPIFLCFRLVAGVTYPLCPCPVVADAKTARKCAWGMDTLEPGVVAKPGGQPTVTQYPRDSSRRREGSGTWNLVTSPPHSIPFLFLSPPRPRKDEKQASTTHPVFISRRMTCCVTT